MNRRTVLATGGSTLAAVTAGCTDAVTGDREPPSPDSDQWQRKSGVDGGMADDSTSWLLVEQHHLARAGDDAKVSGVVKNTSDDAVDEVSLTARLYRDGEAFERGETTLRNGLDPSQTARFDIVIEDVEDRSVDRYTVQTGAV